MKQTTLCFPVIGDPITKVLLGYKKQGFGAGKYTGFGGKIEAGETSVFAAGRELSEEAGLSVDAEHLNSAGVLTFIFPQQPSWNQEVHLFLTRVWDGEPVESTEMQPRWFNVDAIPYDEMWDDARYWMELLLDGVLLGATCTFAADNQTVSQYVQANELGESSLTSDCQSESHV